MRYESPSVRSDRHAARTEVVVLAPQPRSRPQLIDTDLGKQVSEAETVVLVCVSQRKCHKTMEFDTDYAYSASNAGPLIKPHEGLDHPWELISRTHGGGR